jgi:hypothetical protein
MVGWEMEFSLWILEIACGLGGSNVLLKAR